MDMNIKKAARQQYRLKGATRILSENSIEEPNKDQMDLDSTTAFNFNDSSSAANNSSCNNSSASQTCGGGPANALYQTLDASNTTTTAAAAAAATTTINNTSQIHYNPAAIASTSASSSSTTSSYGGMGAQPPSSLANSMTQTSASNNNNNNNSQQQQHAFRSQPPTQQFLPDIRSLFECPICFDYAVPPIYQCQNGHLVCQGCSSKINHCPTCRVPITEPSIRNLQLDRLANTFHFPCKYDFNGCPWKSYWDKKRDHEETCAYISYSCPCPGTACKWTGLLSQVMPHLNEHHKSITTLSGEDIVFLATDVNLKGAVDWVMIQSCFNHHFLLVLEKQELKNGQQQFFAVVQLIGSQKEADKFRYKLELSNNHSGQVTKRLQYDATPRSILEGIHSAISTYDCLVFDARVAQHFLSPIQKDKDSAGQGNNSAEGLGENLGINVTIDRIL